MSTLLLEPPAQCEPEDVRATTGFEPTWLRVVWASGFEPPRRPAPRSRRAGRSARETPPEEQVKPARVRPQGGRPRRRVRAPGPVLIVEDNAVIRATLSEVLRSQGLEVVVAGSTAEGLDVALRERPSAIVLDVRLPDGSGIALARRLKVHEQTRDVPVIVLTAAVTEADRADAAALGVEAYLSKPPDLPAIVRLIVGLTRRGPAPAIEDVEDPEDSEEA